MTANSKPIVTLTALPKQSILHDRICPTDFVDCYSIDCEIPARLAAETITNFPDWAQRLLQVRTIVTAPFGLSSDGPAADDKIGPFPVEQETTAEIIAGFNDKHLDFRVSVYSDEGRVSLATWVHPHNLGGSLYLKLIMPFHILIARDAMKRLANSSCQPAV